MNPTHRTKLARRVWADQTSDRTLPSLKDMGIQTAQRSGREWLERVKFITQTGQDWLVLLPGGTPAVITNYEPQTVNGYPGFKFKFAIPEGGKIIVNDHYNSLHTRPAKRTRGENAVLLKPGPRRRKNNLRKLGQLYPKFYHTLLKIVRNHTTPDPSRHKLLPTKRGARHSGT